MKLQEPGEDIAAGRGGRRQVHHHEADADPPHTGIRRRRARLSFASSIFIYISLKRFLTKFEMKDHYINVIVFFD